MNVIANAVTDCSNPGHQVPSFEAWRSGSALLDLTLMYNVIEQYHIPIRMTLVETLVGLRNWVIAYAGVYVRFGIYRLVSPDQILWIGYGILTQWVENGSTNQSRSDTVDL